MFINVAFVEFSMFSLASNEQTALLLSSKKYILLKLPSHKIVSHVENKSKATV